MQKVDDSYPAARSYFGARIRSDCQHLGLWTNFVLQEAVRLSKVAPYVEAMWFTASYDLAQKFVTKFGKEIYHMVSCDSLLVTILHKNLSLNLEKKFTIW